MLHAHIAESEVVVDKIIEQINIKLKPGQPKPRVLPYAKQGAVILCTMTVPQTICL